MMRYTLVNHHTSCRLPTWHCMHRMAAQTSIADVWLCCQPSNAPVLPLCARLTTKANVNDVYVQQLPFERAPVHTEVEQFAAGNKEHALLLTITFTTELSRRHIQLCSWPTCCGSD